MFAHSVGCSVNLRMSGTEPTASRARSTEPFDLDGPIVPGEQAAGIILGTEATNCLARTRPRQIEHLPGVTRYDFGQVAIWESSGRVDQIALLPGYRGSIDGVVRIGSTIADVEAHFASPVQEDDEDNLARISHQAARPSPIGAG